MTPKKRNKVRKPERVYDCYKYNFLRLYNYSVHPIAIRRMGFKLCEAKVMHKWLGQAIKYLESKKE